MHHVKYAVTFVSWLILWLILGMILTILGIGIAQAQPRLYGPFDTPLSPYEINQTLSETSGWTNVTMRIDCWDRSQLQTAQSFGRRVICRWPWDWQPTSPPPMDQVEVWAANIRSFGPTIAGILVCDECDCLVPFSQWTVGRCNAASAALDQQISVINTVLPGVPTWLNYTSAFFNWFQYRDAAGVRFPTRVNWLSLDCYTVWTACFGRVSVDALYNATIPYLRSDQRFILIPPAARFLRVSGTLALTSEQVVATAPQYFTYATSQSRVLGIIPFIWWDRSTSVEEWVGMRNDPAILSTFQNLGRSWLGVPPVPPTPPRQVTGVRIVRD